MEYDTEQLKSLMAEVETQFSAHLAKAEESFKLAKSEGFPPKKDESKEKDEKKASSESDGESKKPMETEKPEDKGAKDQDQQADDKAGHSDQKEPGENKEAPKAAEGAPADGEGHGYDDEDMQHMHSMYSSMSKPELKAHHDCIRKCMDGSGMAKCEDGMAKAETGDAAKDAEGYRPNGGPTDGEAASKKTPAETGAQAINKSETDVVVEDVSLIKSEFEAFKAKSAEEKKTLETAVTTLLMKFVNKNVPAGKAITSLDVIAKTESEGSKEKTFSKSEVDAKLLAKSREDISKADRDAINSYYFSKNIETVRHLLA